jgi:hypothetical protein
MQEIFKTEFINFSKFSLSVTNNLGLATNHCLSEDHTKHKIIFCGQISEIFNVTAIGTCHNTVFQKLMTSFQYEK